MFTGLVSDTGVIRFIKIEGKGMFLQIESYGEFLNDIKIGNSISVDGVCLTVTEMESGIFTVFAMKETVERTTLKSGLKLKNKIVNLEKSLKIGDRLDGHLVYGHVDFTSKKVSYRKEGYARVLKFQLPSNYKKYVVKKGSIAVNGVSLTVKELDISSFSVSIIPETLERTNLSRLKNGELVNIELDIVGKYMENFIKR